jgi:hypothetical protein
MFRNTEEINNMINISIVVFRIVTPCGVEDGYQRLEKLTDSNFRSELRSFKSTSVI